MSRNMTDPTRDAAFALLSAVLDRHRTLEEALDALPAMDAARPRRRPPAGRRGAAPTRLAGRGAGAVSGQGAADAGAPCAAARRRRAAAARHAGACRGGHRRGVGARAWPGSVRRAGQRGAAPGGRKPGRRRSTALDGPRLDTPRVAVDGLGRRRRGPSPRRIRHEAPLDLSLTPGAAAPEGGVALPTGSWRYPAGTRVTELPGFADGAVLGAGRRRRPARPAARSPARRARGRSLCRARRQDRATGRRRRASSPPSSATRPDSAGCASNLARLRLHAEVVGADAAAWQPPAPARRGAAGRAVQRHRHDPPPPRRAAPEARRATSAASPTQQDAAARRRRAACCARAGG